MRAAEAALCAADQDAFWPYHRSLFENEGLLSQNELEQLARAQGLDDDLFEECLDSGRYRQTVIDQLEEGKAKGVASTPTIFVNGEMITGAQSFEVFEEAIERALANARQ